MVGQERVATNAARHSCREGNQNRLRKGERRAMNAQAKGHAITSMPAGAIHVDGGFLVNTPWGWITVDDSMLDDLSSFTGRTRDDCLDTLAHYQYGQMADAWKQERPKTSEEIRAFYRDTDAYVWSLSLWHASSSYNFHRNIVKQMATLHRGRTGLRALDYGSGVGTTAIMLAEQGYKLTIADVPSVTFQYAQHRLRRRNLSFEAIEIVEDVPPLPQNYHAIVCFDVLEHVPAPDAVYKQLLGHLAPGGLISVVAPFDEQSDQEGYHLRDNYLHWGKGRWNLFTSGCGMRSIGHIHTFDTPWKRRARALHYHLWRLSGIDVRYKTRVIHER